MYRPERVRHIEFNPVHLVFDARHVFNAINAAKREGRITLTSAFTNLEIELGQLSLHLATRANIIRTAVNMMDGHMEELIKIMKLTTDPPQYAIKVPDSILYGLLLAMDSFFFEAKAFEEALRAFLMRAAKHLLGWTQDAARAKYNEIISKAGLVNDEPWGEFLFRVRMNFIHKAAPWIAVDTSRSDENVFDFLIISENITDFAVARLIHFSWQSGT